MPIEIQVSYGYTKNLGNYESERVDASIKISIPDGLCQQDIETIRQDEFTKCKGFVRKQLGFDKEIEEDMQPTTARRRSFGRKQEE